MTTLVLTYHLRFVFLLLCIKHHHSSHIQSPGSHEGCSCRCQKSQATATTARGRRRSRSNGEEEGCGSIRRRKPERKDQLLFHEKSTIIESFAYRIWIRLDYVLPEKGKERKEVNTNIYTKKQRKHGCVVDHHHYHVLWHHHIIMFSLEHHHISMIHLSSFLEKKEAGGLNHCLWRWVGWSIKTVIHTWFSNLIQMKNLDISVVSLYFSFLYHLQSCYITKKETFGLGGGYVARFSPIRSWGRFPRSRSNRHTFDHPSWTSKKGLKQEASSPLHHPSLFIGERGSGGWFLAEA